MAKLAFWIFLGLYAVAVLLLLIGTFGLFGQSRDPLSAIGLIPLGLPWNLIGDRFGLASPMLAIGAPLINLALLWLLWRLQMMRGRDGRLNMALMADGGIIVWTPQP